MSKFFTPPRRVECMKDGTLRVRDTILTPPTAAELAAAGAAVYEPNALGTVWNGLLESITSTLDSLEPSERNEIVQKMAKYSANNWHTDASGTTCSPTGDSRNKGMTDGARQARDTADKVQSINERNAEFWAKQNAASDASTRRRY
jgi:hypothetical protein